jgi:hypothetical protein
MIKIDIDKSKTTHEEYPYLGISESSSTIVLFISEDFGIEIINSDGEHAFRQGKWYENAFHKFNGTITLSNG